MSVSLPHPADLALPTLVPRCVLDRQGCHCSEQCMGVSGVRHCQLWGQVHWGLCLS